LERTTARLAEIEARNEQMRVELAQSASQSSGRSTAVEDEPAYLRLRSENSSLLRRIDNARYDKESETSALESKLRGIEREVGALKADRESLQARVQKWSDYDEVKRELEMLRSIEFAAVDEADLEPTEAPSANGNADKSKGETLEQLLIARNKKLSNELTDLRVSNNELQKRLEELQEDFSTANADLEKAQNLNASLENDLQRTQQEASNAFETMSVAGTYTSRFPKSAYGSRRGGATSPTSSIIGGFDPSSGSGPSLRPGEGVEEDRRARARAAKAIPDGQHPALRSLKPAKGQPQPLRENTLRLDLQPRRPAFDIGKRLRLQPQPVHHPSLLRQHFLRPITRPLPLDVRKQHLPLRRFPRPRERTSLETHELARAACLPDHAPCAADADEQELVCDVLPGAALARLHHASLSMRDVVRFWFDGRASAIWQRKSIDKPATRYTPTKADRQMSPRSDSIEKKPAVSVNANRQRQDKYTSAKATKHATTLRESGLAALRQSRLDANNMQVIRSDRRLEALAWTFFSTLVSLSLAADGLKVGLEAERYNSLVVAGCWTKNGVAVADWRLFRSLSETVTRFSTLIRPPGLVKHPIETLVPEPPEGHPTVHPAAQPAVLYSQSTTRPVYLFNFNAVLRAGRQAALHRTRVTKPHVVQLQAMYIAGQNTALDGAGNIASSFSVLSHLARPPPLDRLHCRNSPSIIAWEGRQTIDTTASLLYHHINMKFLLHTALLATVTIAAPTAHWGQESEAHGGRGAYNGWDESSKAASYADFGRAWHHGRGSKRGSCDLKNAVMPA
ncbi:9833_t:CDS:2, partial [Scutellospora calospora]